MSRALNRLYQKNLIDAAFAEVALPGRGYLWRLRPNG
jgi:hypothetical protein